jgi:hypothetical protein
VIALFGTDRQENWPHTGVGADPMQRSFSELAYAAKQRVTRRDCFWVNLKWLVLRVERVAAIEPIYPKARYHRPLHANP